MIKNIEDLKVEGTMEETEVNTEKTGKIAKMTGWMKDNRKTIVTGVVAFVGGVIVGKRLGINTVEVVSNVCENSEAIEKVAEVCSDVAANF